jgi:hypothetical protein
MIGQHPNASACIDALRDFIAMKDWYAGYQRREKREA